jgi:tripartite-type tricarboxylate transporter receptor subunit TctC
MQKAHQLRPIAEAPIRGAQQSLGRPCTVYSGAMLGQDHASKFSALDPVRSREAAPVMISAAIAPRAIASYFPRWRLAQRGRAHGGKVATVRTLAGFPVFLLLTCAMCAVEPAGAQRFPDRPIRLVVPYAPGGNIDITARIVSPGMSEALGVSILVDNRAGAGGAIGSDLVAKAPPDGYTLLLGSTGSTTGAAAIYPKLPYDPVRDFAPIGFVSNVPVVIVVHPALPARTVKELVALAKSKPGRLTYGSGGTGTTNHLAAALFEVYTGTKLTHVPYKGMGPATVDLMGGQIDAAFDQLSAAIPYIKSGKTRALALASPTRSKLLPELPTLKESGVSGADASTFSGILAPAATPRDTVVKLNAALIKTLSQESTRERFTTLGAEISPSSPEQLGQFIKDDLAKWAKVVKAAGIKIE